MIELEGKYGKAIITIDNVEQGVISQTISMLNTEPFTNPVRIMPDTHEGKGSVIGLTVKCNGKVCPNTIGVDIGCGMTASSFDIDVSDFKFKEVDTQIRKAIPLGFNIHSGKKILPVSILKTAQGEADMFTMLFNDMMGTDYESPFFTENYFINLCERIGTDPMQVVNSCGTLGGGNHFIEIDRDKDGFLWSVVHSGSRNFGLKIATYHQKKAGKTDLAFLEGEDAFAYFSDMFIAQQFASVSRRVMSDIIADILDTTTIAIIESVHNYVDPLDMIIRKGAIRSYAGELMIIPFNMRDGTIICEGKSNPEWNYSAPHGAGRVMSRSQAKRVLSMDKYENDMSHIFTTSVNAGTLDEAPDCYKDYRLITDAIEPTAEIITVLKPVYNLKG